MASKSLGRLTIDIMAKTSGIDKGTREGRKQFRQLEKDAEKAANTVKLGFVAMAAASVAAAGKLYQLAQANAKVVESQGDLARSMNATVTGLRAVNAAAGDHSIEGMEGSLNRLNRRLGAVENGGGPAAAAIKALNLNTEELGKQDADQKLITIAQAIKESGASAQQATRYLQDMGFEQKGVYNLFKDGGESIKAVRGEIERFGLAISDIEFEQIKQANHAFDDMQDTFDGIVNQLTIRLAPILNAIGTYLSDLAKEGQGAADIVGSGFDKMVNAVAFAMDAVEGLRRTFEIAGKGIAVSMLVATKVVLEIADSIINGPVEAINLLIDQMNKLPKVNIEKISLTGFGQSVREQSDLATQAIKEGMADMQATLLEPLPSTAFKQFVADAEEASLAAAQVAVANRVDMPTAAANDAVIDAEQVDVREDPEILRLIDLTKVREELLYERYEAEREMLTQALAGNQITVEEYNDAMLGSETQYQEALTELQKRENQARMQTAQSALSSLSTLMNSESRKAFEVGKAAAIANTVVNTAMAAMSSYNSLSGIPIVGPALGAAAAAAAVAAGVVQIQNIKKTKFGGGSAGVSNTQAVNNAAEPVGGGQGAAAPQQNIYMQGIKRDELYDGAQLLDVMNKQIESGGRLVGYG